MTNFETEDIRAAVAADILTEKQAASLISLAQTRNGQREAMAAEDEPFEFFKGFSEIFVTVGLGLLLAGMLAFSGVIGGGVAMPIVGLIFCWVFSIYIIRKRRMTLPGMFLAMGVALFTAATLFAFTDDPSFIALSITGMIMMAFYFRIFRLPFSMFILGAYAFLGIFALISGYESPNDVALFGDGPSFDLQSGSAFAWASLIAGVLAFMGGMYFDLRDPNRISRLSATGFWLHLLAAPAIVNTVAFSLLSADGNVAYLYTAIALFFITLLALIIDRRSFLTAGIGYLAAILIWALGNSFNEGAGIVMTLIILGAFITALGVFWVQIRARLMHILPNFPGKHRLPPYKMTIVESE
ncbi:hypothetical protein [Halocynthiibacter sp.]|uniref:hypothetical protein n=1 Tax=Halocynthiibacter sp. TaxID=1979210 RepID=UPI003C65E19D